MNQQDGVDTGAEMDGDYDPSAEDSRVWRATEDRARDAELALLADPQYCLKLETYARLITQFGERWTVSKELAEGVDLCDEQWCVSFTQDTGMDVDNSGVYVNVYGDLAAFNQWALMQSRGTERDQLTPDMMYRGANWAAENL